MKHSSSVLGLGLGLGFNLGHRQFSYLFILYLYWIIGIIINDNKDNHDHNIGVGVDACTAKILTKPISKLFSRPSPSTHGIVAVESEATAAVTLTKINAGKLSSSSSASQLLIASSPQRIYPLSQQVPMARRILNSIEDRLHQYATFGDYNALKTHGLATDIRVIITHTTAANKGTAGFFSIAQQIRLMKHSNARGVAPYYGSFRNDMLENIALTFETFVTKQKINRIIEGIEPLDDVARQMKKDIMIPISSMEALERQMDQHLKTLKKTITRKSIPE